MSEQQAQLIPVERILQSIYLIRGQKVMLDRDLAVLYGVKAIALRQQVKGNKEHFPPTLCSNFPGRKLSFWYHRM